MLASGLTSGYLPAPMHAGDPTALGSAYHTTNVYPGTASQRAGQSYPESRILWRPCVSLPGLMEQAANNLALVFDLPSLKSVEQVLQSEVWQEARTWSESILRPKEAAPREVPEEHYETSTENESDADDPEW